VNADIQVASFDDNMFPQRRTKQAGRLKEDTVQEYEFEENETALKHEIDEEDLGRIKFTIKGISDEEPEADNRKDEIPLSATKPKKNSPNTRKRARSELGLRINSEPPSKLRSPKEAPKSGALPSNLANIDGTVVKKFVDADGKRKLVRKVVVRKLKGSEAQSSKSMETAESSPIKSSIGSPHQIKLISPTPIHSALASLLQAELKPLESNRPVRRSSRLSQKSSSGGGSSFSSLTTTNYLQAGKEMRLRRARLRSLKLRTRASIKRRASEIRNFDPMRVAIGLGSEKLDVEEKPIDSANKFYFEF
jgi:hypothetical protein